MLYYSTLKQWILPYYCILCSHKSNRSQDLCEPCFHHLPTPHFACPRCAQSLINNHYVCGTCIKEDPPFDVTFTAFLYQPPIIQLVSQLKFQHQLINARILGELLIEKICHRWYLDRRLPEAIIPVPLHTERLKERGFNQVVEIARPVAKALNLPLLYQHCVRYKATAAQATLPAKNRAQNIKNAFAVIKPITAQHIAVIDDVITTGQTIKEFCKVLKKSGIKKIDVWCIARPAFIF